MANLSNPLDKKMTLNYKIASNGLDKLSNPLDKKRPTIRYLKKEKKEYVGPRANLVKNF